jgi:kynurenine formamidase
MPLQGATQWDSLAHIYYGGSFYNGNPLDTVTSEGAQKLGIHTVRDRFVGRAVLIDVVKYKGGKIDPGYGITRADIEGALQAQDTEVESGDMVIIRTGSVPYFYNSGPEVRRTWAMNQTGITADVVPWIKENEISAVAADNLAIEQWPNKNGMDGAVHGNLLRDLGVFIGEIWWLEDLAADCAEDGRYEFFLSAPPLYIPGAVGSPINPVAVK